MSWEYGVAIAGEPVELHRGPMSIEDACEWVEDVESNERLRGLFWVIRREVSKWEHAV